MFMGSEFGIGQRIFEAYNTYSIDELYALVIIIGFIGYIANFAFYKIEKNLTKWVVK
jgi:NitT/TauT family transport system permease protein